MPRVKDATFTSVQRFHVAFMVHVVRVPGSSFASIDETDTILVTTPHTQSCPLPLENVR